MGYMFELEELMIGIITSFAENEGKSTVSSNLALSLARKGNKVLLMDLDLDGDITLVDALAAYNLIEAAEYDAAADLDKDGELTLVDFLALYDYLSGAKDYEDIVALG